MAELEITCEAELHLLFEHAERAAKEFATFSQEKVDRIFHAAAMAACRMRIPLAQLAVEETGVGLVEDKVIKNHFASEYIYSKFKDELTCGEIERDVEGGFYRVAEPLGILVGVTPVTNPTSTTIFKSLLALKTRNCIIFSPHPRAGKCTCEAARIVYRAAVAAGAPEYCISWLSKPTTELCGILMRHPKTNCILATGGGFMVTAAYSSGNPAIGVGPGNTPTIIDEHAELDNAVSKIIMSKSFDYGVICASDQVVIAHTSVYDEVKRLFGYRGALVVTPEEKAKLTDVLFTAPHPATGVRGMNPRYVGTAPEALLKAADLSLPAVNPRLLVAECTNDIEGELWCHEKLNPCVALVRAETWEEALALAERVLKVGGMGHTASLHTSPSTDVAGGVGARRIAEFRGAVSAGRCIVNSPAAHGALGDLWNFRLDPSLTLGCGSYGKNSVSENIAPRHLLNIKTVAIKRENMLWFRNPPKIFFKRGCLSRALTELRSYRRAFLVTDKFLFNLGFTKRVTGPLEAMGMTTYIFSDVEPDPSLSCAKLCAKQIADFKPDVILALGGGSAIDLMKISRLLYEHPGECFDDLCARFMDILKRIHTFPPLTDTYKTYSVCIPTTSGTGAEVTPFSVITDDAIGVKYPLADYELTPHMAIIDGDLVDTMPPGLIAFTGLDALTHAIESYVSIMATEFTKPMSLQAIKMVFDYLTKSYQGDLVARDYMHQAATIAGIAFANAFLGVNHSLAHKMGQKWHIPHGLANAQVMLHVIRYNATEAPPRMGCFPQYQRPVAISRYAEIARYLGLDKTDATTATATGMKEVITDGELVERLINAIRELMASVKVSPYVCDSRDPPTREAWMAAADELALYAFDDQCTGANPRYPLVHELADILRCVYSPEDDTYHTRFPLM